MFRGDSCYPISPVQDQSSPTSNDLTPIDNNDQILSILRKQKIDKKQDTSFFTEEQHFKYIEMMEELSGNNQKQPPSLRKLYSPLSENLIHILG